MVKFDVFYAAVPPVYWALHIYVYKSRINKFVYVGPTLQDFDIDYFKMSFTFLTD